MKTETTKETTEEKPHILDPDQQATKPPIILPDESGEELIKTQTVIPSPCWEPFIQKSSEDKKQ